MPTKGNSVKKYKTKNVNQIENSMNCDKPLQYNIPKGVKDSKKISQKEVFGKQSNNKKVCPRGHKVCKCK
jgi:hypothetical protein